ncbi:DUF4241 domain-containing protein [Propionibacterium sp.]|uniref:DUF4241 domain-containing protein n=1 Tax=Propionibacterium sp. TaxID=1977903 RepID=UPI0039EA8931
MDVSNLLALRPGRIEGWQYSRKVYWLGQLQVPSGRLRACDPFANLDDGLVFPIPPGRYPVYVTVADVSDAQNGSQLRESYLSLVLADGQPARLGTLIPENAAPPAGPPSDNDDFYGVPVYAGTVGFTDADAVARCMPEGDWYEQFFDNGEDDSWFALMDSPQHHIENCANIVLPNATAGENVVLCHSGWGDGFYPVIASYDGAGKLLAVHIDLLVEEAEGAPAGGPGSATPGAAATSSQPSSPGTSRASAPESAGVDDATDTQKRPGFWRRLFGFDD